MLAFEFLYYFISTIRLKFFKTSIRISYFLIILDFCLSKQVVDLKYDAKADSGILHGIAITDCWNDRGGEISFPGNPFCSWKEA